MGGISSYANTPATYFAGEIPSECAEWNNAALDKSGLDAGFIDPVKGSTNMDHITTMLHGFKTFEL